MLASFRQILLFSVIFFGLVFNPVFAREPEQTDTRILIDISGSMKKNDPRNLRRSALRLMVGLMQAENRAGVWTFAQYTNMLVPLGIVNKSWKNKARIVSQKISSPGQYTNIEDVLRRSTADWDGPQTKYRRNIVLLTDGMVDISKSKKLNKASRQRIIEELLPKIKAAGAAIHTIALSDRADHALMQKLSTETGGWYEQVNTADELQRVFLRMLEKVSKPDSVPIKGNKFRLDSSIDEATLLVFNQNDASPTKIMSPSGKVYSALNPPDNMAWHRDEGYDLITIRRPESGEWVLQADVDPDNRVMVVTDLKMKTTDIPNRMALGESILVKAWFTENGKTILRENFLDVVNVSATQVIRGVESEARPLMDDGNEPDQQSHDGNFSIVLGEGLDEGMVELVIRADGKTFVRERRQSTEIVQPARLVVKDSPQSPVVEYKIFLDKDVVKKGSPVVDAWMEDLGGERMPIDFSASGDYTLKAKVDKNSFFGRKFVVVNVSGKTLSGNDFVFQPETVDIEGNAEPPPPPEPEPVPESKPAEKPATEAEVAEPAAEPVAETTETEAPPPEEETDWTTVAIIILVGNLLLIGIGLGIWWYIRKKSSPDETILIDEDEEDDLDTVDEAEDNADKKDDQAEGEDTFDLDADLESDNEISGDDATIDISEESDK